MPGERRCLVGDALHEAAVTGDDEGVVVLGLGTEAGAQIGFGDRHADRIGEALAERPGGDLDAGSVTGLRVAGRRRVPLAELLQVVEFEAISAQEEQRVLQDRGVAVREDESVTVRPGRIGRVVAKHPAVEDVTEWGQRHRRPLVATVGSERTVHRHPPDERDGELVLFRSQRHGGDSTRPVVDRTQPSPTILAKGV